MADSEVAHKLIDELRYPGITITLDDFGIGYSSMVALLQPRPVVEVGRSLNNQ